MRFLLLLLFLAVPLRTIGGQPDSPDYRDLPVLYFTTGTNYDLLRPRLYPGDKPFPPATDSIRVPWFRQQRYLKSVSPGKLLLEVSQHSFWLSDSLPATHSWRAEVRYRPRPDLRFHYSFEALSRDPEPALYRATWRGFHAGSRDAHLDWEGWWGRLRLGRFALSSGPDPRENLLLTARETHDGVLLTLGNNSAKGFWGELFQLQLSDSHDTTGTYQRYLNGHRLGYTVPGAWSVALTEAFLFGGRGLYPSWRTLNPLLPYHAEQMNGLEGNTMFHLAAWWRPRNHWLLEAELLLDDVQVDRKTAADREPAEYGGLLRFRWFDERRNLLYSGSYTRITQRTYNSLLPYQRWQDRERLLAHSLGSDFDRWELQLSWLGSSRWRPSYSLALTRRGEHDARDPFDTPWLEGGEDFSEAFPTGAITRILAHRLGLEMSFRGLLGGVFLETNATKTAGNPDPATHRETRIRLDLRLDLEVFHLGRNTP